MSALTGQVLKWQQSTAVRDHMLDCHQVVKPDDFILMTRDNSDYFLQIRESLFISRDDSSLNLLLNQSLYISSKSGYIE